MGLFYRWNRLLHPFIALDWIGSHSADMKPTRLPAGKIAAPVDQMYRFGLEKTEAEDLLDWLEANGCPHYEISSTGADKFAVHWWN